MLLAAIYEYTWTVSYLLIFYLVIYLIDPYTFFSPKGWFDKPEIYLKQKLNEYRTELLKAVEENPNNCNKYYFLGLLFILRKLIYIWDNGLRLIPYALSRLDRLLLAFMSISVQIILLPLTVTLYWGFVIYWLLKLIYYWLISKLRLKKFRSTNKTGINKMNPIIFNNDDTMIPINCKTHNFIPKSCHSFKKSSKIYPTVNYGFFEVKNQELWHYKPLIDVSFINLLTKFMIELLIRVVIKRPYVWDFHFWSRLVSFLSQTNKEVTSQSLIYGVLKSVLCILIVGVPLFIIDLTAFMTASFRFSSDIKKFRLYLHEFFVDNIFEKFSCETSHILYSSPLPIDVESTRPI